MQTWTIQQLERVVNNRKSPVVEVRAAQRWLSDDGEDFDRICDRTKGKPMQPVRDETPEKSPQEVSIVAMLIELCVPEEKWPPTTLARWKAGLIKIDSGLG